jgi:hypothetical protein
MQTRALHLVTRCSLLALLPALAGAGMVAFEPPTPQPSQPTHAEVAGAPDVDIADASTQLKRTHVTSYLTCLHVPHTSLLWCSTFQIAWDQFNQVGDPLAFEGNPPMAVQLSAHPFPANGLDDASYVAMIGSGPQTIDRIKAELDSKFHGAASPKVLPSKSEVKPGDLVAYAYLFKNLAFETPLSQATHGMTFGPTGESAARYRAFGIFHDTTDRHKVVPQLTIWHHTSPADFVIELRTREARDRLIIARLEPGATLKETVERAVAKIRNATPLPGLAEDERVMIPVLNFDVTRSYDEITNIPCTTRNSPVAYIASAKQNIRFRLDEKGAVLKSDAAILAPRGLPPPKKTEPRQFICDGPFLVLLQRADADTPYFAAWIDNPELLSPQK